MGAATTIKPVPLLDVRAQLAGIRGEIEDAIGRVLDHGQFILGPEVRELEARIAQYCGCREAVACASGSDALLLALMALGVGAGDAVITTPYTFFATAGSIARLGARPMFVDIDPATYNMDPQRLEDSLRALPARELSKIKAVIPVHLFGQCADMAAINRIALEYGLPVVEDAAQAIGAEFNGARAGSLGVCGCLSFFPSKNLGCLGDGGAITTNDTALADKLRVLRVHGARPKYYHRLVGLNSRLDTLQAAVLLVKLKRLDDWTRARRSHAEWYIHALRDAGLGLPVEAPGRRHVYNQFVVRSRERDRLMQKLRDAGVGCEIYYPLPLHLQECFAWCGAKAGDFPESERAAAETLALPVQPELDEAGLNRVASVILQ